jgi:hypothetical protein
MQLGDGSGSVVEAAIRAGWTIHLDLRSEAVPGAARDVDWAGVRGRRTALAASDAPYFRIEDRSCIHVEQVCPDRCEATHQPLVVVDSWPLPQAGATALGLHPADASAVTLPALQGPAW